MPDVALTTPYLIGLVAGSSVLAAIVTQGVTALREWWQSNRDAGLSALYLAIALESYANDCAAHIGDSEVHEASGGHAGSPRGSVATLPDFPKDVNWKALGLQRSTQALSFRVEVETVRAMIADMWEFVQDEDIVVPEVRERTAQLGQKALKLASGFRKAWKIAAVDYGNEWNVSQYLDERTTEYRVKREAREARHRASLDELNAGNS